MAITTNFLKTNGLLNSGVNKASDLQQAEQEGRAKLEGKFPKNVSNKTEIHYQVEYVNINGQNYAVIGYPTYKQNAQGSFDFVSMTCEVKEIPNGATGIVPSEDKSQIEWYGSSGSTSLSDSGVINGNSNNKPFIQQDKGRTYGSSSLNNSGFVNGPSNNKPYLR